MKEKFITFINNQKIAAILVGLSFLFILGGFLLIVTHIKELAPSIVIHFDSFRGVDRIGEKTELWFIWSEVFLFITLNAFLAYYLYFRERIFTYIFLIVNVLLSIFLFISLATIISVN